MKNSDWISVSDRLPETDKKYGVPVLVYRKWKYASSDSKFNHDISISPFARGRFWFAYAGNQSANDFDSQVTHWMPLPERPKP